ncbi:MAG TPA: PaaI family thioesterase, partial [Spongiibacteraceae bacterium]|nr:PaaI family thioesterase [Spongiibacteraceae bacterium]
EERQVKKKRGQPGTATPDVIARYSGMEFMQAMARSELDYPPIADTLNFTLIHFEPGRVIFQGTPLFAHYNPIGSVHGGWYCTLLDSALGCVVQTKLPKGRGYTTLELKANMIRALTTDTGPVRAEATIIHVGRQTGIAEARLYDSAGKIYASASTTCLIFDIAN